MRDRSTTVPSPRNHSLTQARSAVVTGRGPRGSGRTARSLLSAALALAPAMVLGSVLLTPSNAHASVNGKRGVEIEGGKDRRGVMGGLGVGALNTVFLVDGTDSGPGARLAPAPEFNAIVGGGVTKRFTLGVRMSLAVFAAPKIAGAVAAGGDVEATGYVFKGLYLRGGLGLMAIPRGWDSKRMTAGPGGRFGIGYEFFLNQTAAMDVGLSYDIRITPEVQPRHSVFLGMRFMFY